MDCTCQKRIADRKWKAEEIAREMYMDFGYKFNIKKGFDNQERRVFTILAVSKDCPRHRIRFVIREGGISYD